MKQVRLIELELSSKCNLQCKFCPNKFLDRFTFNEFLDEEVFNRLIDELASINYSNYISLSRYNEPFLYPEVVRKRIDYIKEKLPDVKIVANTNGTALHKLFMDDIDITVMDYTKPLPFKINNRGGSLEGDFPLRTVACYEPTYFIGIDYTGDVVPCCNIRGDNPEHENFILGNIYNNTLSEIFNNPSSIEFREMVKNKEFPEPCKYCTKMEGRYTRDNPDKEGDMT